MFVTQMQRVTYINKYGLLAPRRAFHSLLYARSPLETCRILLLSTFVIVDSEHLSILVVVVNPCSGPRARLI